MEEQKNKKYFIMGILISICCLVAIYIGISMYFMNRFYFGSSVNCINVSGKTVEQADEQISNEISSYTIELEGRDSLKEEIKASDINLKYDPNGKIQELKDNENPFGWIGSVFTQGKNKIHGVVTFDEGLLKKRFEKLSCITGKDIVEPKNPSFEYENGQYKIIDEVKGNKINKEVLYDKLKEAILNGERTLDLDKRGCYEEPKYTADSPEAKKAKEDLDKYVKADVSYSFGDDTEEINGSVIKDWLEVDDNLNATFNEKKVTDYVNTLASKYNTVGKQRDFVTSLGTTIKVAGGSYGWAIDKKGQTKEIIDDVKNGDKETKDGLYTQKGLNKGPQDIGNTYVEVNLGSQHLWFYKDGKLVTEGNIVSGNVSNGTATPSGVYKLNYKERNATLKGEGYSTPVSYWMPFNGGIGIHDATWRSAFGGSIYRTGGSHGCVNAPYTLAQTIFGSIDAGTPIVCYY